MITMTMILLIVSLLGCAHLARLAAARVRRWATAGTARPAILPNQ